MYKKGNTAKEPKVSTVTLKNWVGLDSRANTEKYIAENQADNNATEFEAEYITMSGNTKTNYYNIENTKNICSSINSGFAIESHPNIEALAHCLIEKIDALDNKQIDIHNVEIITDRVFHNIEKLKHEIRNTNDYVQKLEHKNIGLETRIDLLISQNEAMIEHCTQIEAMCKSFFSKNIELENKFLTLSQKIYSVENSIYLYHGSKDIIETNTNEEFNNGESFKESSLAFKNDVINNVWETSPKITTDLAENDTNILNTHTTPVVNNVLQTSYTHSSIMQTQRNIENNNVIPDEEIDIKELMKSKTRVESFIKHNYPDDYKMMKQYNKKSIINWFNRVLGLN